MGKAQKLKQQKKLAEQRAAEEKLHKRRRHFRIVAIVLVVLVVAGTIAGLTIGLWPQSYKYQEMVLDTSKGEIRIELLGDAAPNTVQRMTQLVNEGFYTDIRFHRVLDDIAQAGDPQSKDPNADPSKLGTQGSGKKFSNEINPNTPGFADDVNNFFKAEGVDVGHAILEAVAAEQGTTTDQLIAELPSQGVTLDQVLQNWNETGLDYAQALAALYSQQGYPYENTTQSSIMGEGMVAMANTPPQPLYDSSGQPQTDSDGRTQFDTNVNDSQFFIVRHYDTNNIAELLWRYKHTVFGRVVAGMDVVNQLQQGDTINQASIYTQTRHR